MNDFPPCLPDVPVPVCCTMMVPNTSQWQVVCPHGATAPTVIPTLTDAGAVLFVALLAAAAIQRLR